VSDVLYPLSLIEQLKVSRFDRTIGDDFDDGSTSTRRGWPAQYFKRQFALLHAPLTLQEYRYLRSFWSQRSGRYDAFWFRDNVNREGNASVRFAGQLAPDFKGSARRVQLGLEEVGAIRALPEFDEVTVAAGSAPLFWWDANREFYYTHMGTVFRDLAVATYDSMLGTYRGYWQAGTNLNLGNVLGQYQHYAFTGTEWAKTASNVTELTGTQPAFTVFCIARHSTGAADQVLAAVGAAGSASSLGLALKSDNTYRIFYGSITGSSGYTNSPANTWRSLALTTALSSNSSNIYVNASLYATINPAVTRSYGAGPAALGAATDASLIANPANAMANANLAHVMMFAGTLTLAQVKALHNLLGYQYGLALVP